MMHKIKTAKISSEQANKREFDKKEKQIAWRLFACLASIRQLKL
jgi:hypothetical protein